MTRNPFSGVTAPATGRVKVVSATGQSVTLLRNGDIGRTGSVGGWAQSDRILREDADWYQSRTKGAYTIPCMLDWPYQRIPVEQSLATLYAMGYQDQKDPPELRLYGEVPGGGAGQGWRWKLDDIGLAATVYRQDAPALIRNLQLTLTLSTFVPLGRIAAITLGRTRATATTRRTRIYVTKLGDTLRSIAVTQLGASGDYTMIQGWNKQLTSTDPDYPLRPGTKVTLR